MEASAWRQHISLLYGQSPQGIGVVLATAIVDVDATSHDLVFTDANWAPGIWAGAEGAQLNAYRPNGNLIGTNGGTDTLYSVARVNNNSRTVRITGTAQGIIDMETFNDTENITLYFRGSKANDFPGMQVIFSNQSSVLHGIDAAVFGLWAGNLENVGGRLSKSKVLEYVGKLVGRGLRKEDLVLRVNPGTWAILEQDEIALQVFDQSYSPQKAESGVESIWYRGQNGRIEVRSDSCVKGGDAFLYATKRLRRLGSADRDMAIPGQESEPFFPLTGKAGFGWRNFTDLSLYCQTPAKCMFLNGIVNA